MRHFRAYLLAGTIFAGLPVAQPAKAEPITLTLLAATGIEWGLSAGAVSVLTSFLTAAVGIGAQYLISALTPKPGVGPSSSGTSFETTFGPTAPRSAIFGQLKTGGHRIHYNVYGQANKLLQLVDVIGDGLHDSLTGILYNGKKVTLAPLNGSESDGGDGVFAGQGGVPNSLGAADQEFKVTQFEKGGVPYVTLRFFRGFTNQLADPELVAHANPAGTWPSTARGAGVCYVSVTQVYDEDLQLTGPPDIQYIVKGLRLYDPRKDSTNGVGSGSHRWGTESTYEWTDNPSVIEYNVRRGVFAGGQQVLGMRNVTASDLLLPMYVTAANVCDETVVAQDLSSEKRYACSFRMSDDSEPSQALRTIAQAMSGWCLDRYGQFGPIAGAAQVPVRTFSERDMIFDTGFTYSKYRTRTSIVTAVHGRFTDGSKEWDEDAFPPRINTSDDAAIGERIARDIDLTMITSTSRAQRVAEIFRRRTLLQKNGSCVLRPEFIEVDAGDWLTFQSEKEGTFNVVVLEASLNPDGSVPITFEEIASSVYAFTSGEYLIPTPVGPISNGPTLTAAVAGFTPSPVALPSDVAGITKPGVDLVWTPIYDPTVRAIVVEYRKHGDAVSPTVKVALDQPALGSGRVSFGLQALTQYDFRASLITDPVRTTAATGWTTITTTDERVPPGPINWPDLTNPIQGQVTDMLEAIKRLQLEAQRIARAASEQDGHNFLQVKDIRGTIGGYVDELRVVNVTQDAAFAAYQISVGVSFNDQLALININATAIATANGSIASLSTQLIAETTNRTNADATLTASVNTNSSAITTLNASLATMTTNLNSEITNRTNGDVTLQSQINTNATAISTLTSSLATVSTNLSSEVTNRTNGDVSLQSQVNTTAATLSTLSGTVATLNTNLTAEITNRTNGDSTLSASISVNATAIATLNGQVGAMYTIKMSAGNIWGGFYFWNTGATVAIKLDVDTFTVGRSAAGIGGVGDFVQMFTITTINGAPRLLLNGNAYIQKLVVGAIDAVDIIVDNLIVRGKIVAGATSAQVYTALNAGSTSIPSNGVYSMVSAVLNVQSGAANIQFASQLVQWSNSSSTSGTGYLYFYVDGAAVAVFSYPSTTSGTTRTAEFKGVLTWYVTGLSAGNHTFEVKTAAPQGIGFWAGTADTTGGQLFVTEYRR